MGYTVQKNPLDPERFAVYDEGGNPIAKGSYKGRNDEDIIKAATSKNLATDLARAKQSTTKDKAMNLLKQTGGNTKMIDAYKKAQEATKDESLSSEAAVNELLKDVYSFRQGVKSSDELKKLKESGTYGVNTGFISGRIPDIAIEAAGSFAPEEMGKRKQLSQGILTLLNPYRKQVTGSAAAEKEISRYIEPAVPTMKDEDEVFLDALNKYRTDTISNIGLALDQLKRMGKDTSQFDDLISELSVSKTVSPQKKATHKFNPATGKLELVR